MTFGGGFGQQAGERVTGKLDSSSQVKLPIQQGLARIAIDIVVLCTFVAAYFLLGYVISYLIVGVMLWIKKDNIINALHRHARNRNAVRVIIVLDRIGIGLYFMCAWIPLYIVTRWRWWYSMIDRKHFLLFITDNGYTTIPFPILIRLFLLIVIVAVWMSWGVMRDHFEHELMAFFPLAAINPAKDGLDARHWGNAPALEDSTVNVRLVTHVSPAMDIRTRDARHIYPGDSIIHDEIQATQRQWQFVSLEAMQAAPNISESNMARSVNGVRVFEARSWRSFRDACVTAGLMEAAGTGGNGSRAGYRFTEQGLYMFQSRQWSKSSVQVDDA